MYVSGAGLRIRDSLFDNSYTYYQGGSLLATSGATVDIHNTEFFNSTVYPPFKNRDYSRGGAIALFSGASLKMTNSKVSEWAHRFPLV